jgi:hypothetical protein
VPVRYHPVCPPSDTSGAPPPSRSSDQALHAIDLHPRLVPETVKLTAVNLLKDHAIGAESAPQAYRAAAEIVAYCMIGAEAFAGVNGADLTFQTERRIEAAIGSGRSLDAQLVLLTMHAGVIQPSVIEQFQLESADEPSQWGSGVAGAGARSNKGRACGVVLKLTLRTDGLLAGSKG